jgi:hypothetical protein
MASADPERFADAVGARLRQLPLPAAPRTLLPRVMAAAQEWARRPWYARAWFTWPLGWQAASIALLCVLCVLGVGAVLLLPSAASAVARMASVNAAGVLWRTFVRPVAPYAFAFAALMCLACAVFGAALNHVVFGRTVQP